MNTSLKIFDMQRKNRYYRRSHLTERKFCQVLKYFAQDLSATDVAQLTGLTRKTVNAIFLKTRLCIAGHQWEHQQRSRFKGKIGAMGIEVANEEFSAFIKRRLQKFKGVSENTYELHLKECEWRFQRRDHDLYAELLIVLRDSPL